MTATRKPIIGITPSPAVDDMPHGKFRRYTMAANYTKTVEAAGGVPLGLPPQVNNVESLLSVVDGLLFSDGGDADPARNGEAARYANTDGVDELRDHFKFALLKEALIRNVPVF